MVQLLEQGLAQLGLRLEGAIVRGSLVGLGSQSDEAMGESSKIWELEILRF